MRYTLGLIFLALSFLGMAQVGSININVYDEFSQQPLEAMVSVSGEERFFTGLGNVQIDSLQQGNYSFEISAEGYLPSYLDDITIVPNQNISYSIGLYSISEELEAAIITRLTYKTTAESPLSLRSISSEEIQKNAGSNRDVSKAILSFPGVGSTATFRNDLFIRGGSSGENKFY